MFGFRKFWEVGLQGFWDSSEAGGFFAFLFTSRPSHENPLSLSLSLSLSFFLSEGVEAEAPGRHRPPLIWSGSWVRLETVV